MAWVEGKMDTLCTYRMCPVNSGTSFIFLPFVVLGLNQGLHTEACFQPSFLLIFFFFLKKASHVQQCFCFSLFGCWDHRRAPPHLDVSSWATTHASLLLGSWVSHGVSRWGQSGLGGAAGTSCLEKPALGTVTVTPGLSCIFISWPFKWYTPFYFRAKG